MKILGRTLGATLVIASLVGPAWAQTSVPKYGETDKTKSASEIAAEIEQQRVDGGGDWRQIHGNRLQNGSGIGNGLDRFRPDPALKPMRELCYSAERSLPRT